MPGHNSTFIKTVISNKQAILSTWFHVLSFTQKCYNHQQYLPLGKMEIILRAT